jgi:hypothetical protein
MIEEIVFTELQNQSNNAGSPKTDVRMRVAKPEDAQNLQLLIAELMRDGKNFQSDKLPNTTEEEAEYIKIKNHIFLSPDDKGFGDGLAYTESGHFSTCGASLSLKSVIGIGEFYCSIEPTAFCKLRLESTVVQQHSVEFIKTGISNRVN